MAQTVAKLPPMPRKPTKASERRERMEENLLMPLPPLGRWGGLTVGRWAETELSNGTQVVGRCFKCGAIKPAVELRWVDPVFKHEGGWGCQECR